MAYPYGDNGGGGAGRVAAETSRRTARTDSNKVGVMSKFAIKNLVVTFELSLFSNPKPNLNPIP